MEQTRNDHDADRSGHGMSDQDEDAEWTREWGQVTPLPRGGLVPAHRRACSEDATRCDRPDHEIRVIVELSIDDIADAAD